MLVVLALSILTAPAHCRRAGTLLSLCISSRPADIYRMWRSFIFIEFHYILCRWSLSIIGAPYAGHPFLRKQSLLESFGSWGSVLAGMQQMMLHEGGWMCRSKPRVIKPCPNPGDHQRRPDKARSSSISWHIFRRCQALRSFPLPKCILSQSSLCRSF